MSSRVHVIADLHLGHAKVQQLRGVSDQDLVDRWNLLVDKRDVVYVLGDVFKLDLLPRMLGIKKLILGNHDKYPMDRYLQHFTSVAAMHEWDGCILTHIPVHPNQKGRYRLNVHGHMHDKSIEGDDWYRCVSAEQTGYAPVDLRTVCSMRAAQ